MNGSVKRACDLHALYLKAYPCLSVVPKHEVQLPDTYARLILTFLVNHADHLSRSGVAFCFCPSCPVIFFLLMPSSLQSILLGIPFIALYCSTARRRSFSYVYLEFFFQPCVSSCQRMQPCGHAYPVHDADVCSVARAP